MPAPDTYVVKIVTGGTGATATPTAIPDANADPCMEEVNQPEDFGFTLKNASPLHAICRPFEMEAQVWVNAEIEPRWAGPIVGWSSAPDKTTRYECKGLLDYLAQRNIDRGAGRINLLTNPQAEDSPDLTGWTEVDEGSTLTASVSTDKRQLGTKAFKLVSTTFDKANYLEQEIEFTATAIGDLLTLAGWFHVSGTGFLGSAYKDRYLFITHDGGAPNGEDAGIVAIRDEDLAVGVWQRVETTIWVPPSATVTITVRLYSPGGTIYWDALSLTQMESFSKWDTDQADIVAELVGVLQDPDFDKDNAGLSASCPSTGVIRDRHAQFADHHNGLGWVQSEFCALDDGFDISCGVDRVVRTHYPRRGSDLTGSVTLEAGAAGNFRPTRYWFDGKKAANAVASLGSGDGPDREEGSAVDDSLFGGRTVQQAFSPVGDPPIDTLDETARRRLVVAGDPRLLEGEITDSGLAVGLGDQVTVDLPTAFHQAVDGAWRVVRLTTVPHSDRRPVVLVPVAA